MSSDVEIDGDIQILVGRGSQESAIKYIAAKDPDNAVRRVEDAYEHLIESCPSELRQVWPMVIAWGRIQLAYQEAVAMGDLKMQLACAKESAELVRSMY